MHFGDFRGVLGEDEDEVDGVGAWDLGGADVF